MICSFFVQFKMVAYHPTENVWAKRAGQVAGGLALIEQGIDVGRTLWSAGSAIAPYVLALAA